MWHRTDQWTGTESPEINASVYGQLLFHKGAKKRQWSFQLRVEETGGTGTIGYPYTKE